MITPIARGKAAKRERKPQPPPTKPRAARSGSKNRDDRVDNLRTGLGIQDGDLRDHELATRGEELAGPGVAIGPEQAGVEAQCSGERLANLRMDC